MLSAVARQQKFLREKFGGVEDDMHDEDEEDEDEQEGIWGGKMNQYYSADNRDFEVMIWDWLSSHLLFSYLSIYV